jgi:hypothetical protein
VSGERHGTVFIVERFPFGARPTFVGYWDAEPEDPPAVLDEMPETSDVDAAIEVDASREEATQWLTDAVAARAGDLLVVPPFRSIEPAPSAT